jgi:hypothetical protein
MTIVQKINRQIDGATGGSETVAVPVSANTPKAMTEPPLASAPCDHCGMFRPLTHRVRSELIVLTVCAPCAAEVPLIGTGAGALTLERIIGTE